MYKLRLLKLKTLQTEIETKMKLNLSKYNQALQHLSLYDDEEGIFEDDLNDSDNSNQFKGLFFLPNGSAMILMDEELIDKVLSNSITLNFNTNNQSQVIVNNSPRPNKTISQNRTSLSISKINRSTNCKTSKIIEEDEERLGKVLKNSLTQSTCYELFELIKNDIHILDYLRKNSLIDDELGLLETDLLKIFNKKETSDITITVGNIKFYAHKLILISRSKFFEIMLKENMKENHMNEVTLSNCTPEEFLVFLLILYTDNLQFDIDKSLDLMKVNKSNY
jgi:hypothetical protein